MARTLGTARLAMGGTEQNTRRDTSGLPPGTDQRSNVASRFEQFEKRQRELWRFTFVVLLALAIFFSWTSWAAMGDSRHRYEIFPAILLVVIVALFGAYRWNKTKEVSELRGHMSGREQPRAQLASDGQMEQLFEVISRSQQGFRDLIDSFDDLLLALTPDGKIRAANRSFSDLVRTPFQELIGRPLGEFVRESNGQGPDLVKRAMPRFLERRMWTGMVEVQLKNQSAPFYFDCVVHAMLRGSEVHGITVLARDISALRRNETRFTELFETLQEGIYIATPEGRILDANPALVRMLGYESKEELLKRQVAEILIDPAERRALMEQAQRYPVVQDREITLLRKDGGSIVCLNSSVAIRDGAGTIIRYQGAVMDITERREMERRLHQQQEFARRLVDNFPDLILVLDTASHYTFVSPRCLEVLGYTLEESQHTEFGGRTHPEDLPAALAVYQDILSGRQAFASLELRVRHKQGDWRRILFNFSPLSDDVRPCPRHRHRSR